VDAATVDVAIAFFAGGLGMGDVKAGMWMSILTGWLSPTALVIAGAAPFMIQGAVTVPRSSPAVSLTDQNVRSAPRCSSPASARCS
jgi:hypothetical protein